ncbi:hypothetical protein ACTHSY_12405, partial [Neisseria sp. P0013.S004]
FVLLGVLWGLLLVCLCVLVLLVLVCVVGVWFCEVVCVAFGCGAFAASVVVGLVAELVGWWCVLLLGMRWFVSPLGGASPYLILVSLVLPAMTEVAFGW